MKIFLHLAVCIVAIFTSGVSAALTPTFKATIETPLRPVVTGQTNLPDGTELMLSISRAQSHFTAATKVKVAKGAFRSEQFSQHGGNLNPGKYKLEITMPSSQVQPAEVRAVIGMNGEKLSGPLVRRGAASMVVEYVTTFQAGSSSSTQADHNARSAEKLNRARWVRKSCEDIVSMRQPSRTLADREAAVVQCVREVDSKK